MTEVERQGWYVVPALPSPTRRVAAAIRRIVLGIGSRDAHLMVEGWGRTIVEALGWAIVIALDAHARRVRV
jgi:hypothetical protein